MELVMGVGPMNLVITNDALYQLSYTSAATRIRVGPMNLVITNDALYQLSYTSAATRIITKTAEECKTFFQIREKKLSEPLFTRWACFCCTGSEGRR